MHEAPVSLGSRQFRPRRLDLSAGKHEGRRWPSEKAAQTTGQGVAVLRQGLGRSRATSAEAPYAATIRRWHSGLNRTEVNESYPKDCSLYTKVSRSAGNSGGPRSELAWSRLWPPSIFERRARRQGRVFLRDQLAGAGGGRFLRRLLHLIRNEPAASDDEAGSLVVEEPASPNSVGAPAKILSVRLLRPSA